VTVVFCCTTLVVSIPNDFQDVRSITDDAERILEVFGSVNDPISTE
jgi:hypothetical protein